MAEITQQLFLELILDKPLIQDLRQFANRKAAQYPGVSGEDLLQQAWLNTIEYLKKENIRDTGQPAEERLGLYMKTIITHVVHKEARCQLPQVEDLPEHTEFLSILGTLEKKEQSHAIRVALGQLCEKCKEAIVGRFYIGDTYVALAEQLGCSDRGTARRLVMQCVARMQSKLTSRFGDLL